MCVADQLVDLIEEWMGSNILRSHELPEANSSLSRLLYRCTKFRGKKTKDNKTHYDMAFSAGQLTRLGKAGLKKNWLLYRKMLGLK